MHLRHPITNVSPGEGPWPDWRASIVLFLTPKSDCRLSFNCLDILHIPVFHRFGCIQAGESLEGPPQTKTWSMLPSRGSCFITCYHLLSWNWSRKHILYQFVTLAQINGTSFLGFHATEPGKAPLKPNQFEQIKSIHTTWYNLVLITFKRFPSWLPSVRN